MKTKTTGDVRESRVNAGRRSRKLMRKNKRKPQEQEAKTQARWERESRVNFKKKISEGYVNVCIHDFDDAKEESNKAASNDKHLHQE